MFRWLVVLFNHLFGLELADANHVMKTLYSPYGSAVWIPSLPDESSVDLQARAAAEDTRGDEDESDRYSPNEQCNCGHPRKFHDWDQGRCLVAGCGCPNFGADVNDWLAE